jgi:mono/diheme cytochrome c family protein
MKARWIVLSALAVSGLFASSARAGDAKELYEKKCAKCHGLDGDGNGRAGRSLKHTPTAFKDKAATAKFTDDQLVKSIKEGGEAIGQSKDMEGFPTLKDDEVKGLVAYIKTLGK